MRGRVDSSISLANAGATFWGCLAHSPNEHHADYGQEEVRCNRCLRRLYVIGAVNLSISEQSSENSTGSPGSQIPSQNLNGLGSLRQAPITFLLMVIQHHLDLPWSIKQDSIKLGNPYPSRLGSATHRHQRWFSVRSEAEVLNIRLIDHIGLLSINLISLNNLPLALLALLFLQQPCSEALKGWRLEHDAGPLA